ncbi:WxL domain-containing protein [Enterococcus sp. AZ192]|uniref:WxL domain-containing protein n=1 Tax=unclassified Enterococcus TaxID=2608891 RepID=UPI003D2B8A79
MKLTHKLCGAALLATVGVAVAIPNTTKAVEHSLEGKGHIGFTKDTGTKTLTDPGSTSSGVVITSNSTLPMTDPGEFGIIAVTPLEFRTHSVLTADESFNASLYEANGSAYNPAAPATTKDIQNFVAFYDGRENARTYNLSAKSTKFTEGTTKELAGTQITYSNMWMNTHAGGESPDVLAASQVLKTDGTSTKFISNDVVATGTKGFGQHEINFGEVSKNGAAGGADQAVTLAVPKADNPVIVSGDYTATITWTLADVR